MPSPSLRRHELEELLRYARSESQEAKIRAVLEHGTHKAAADSLGIGQAALSRTIQVVEKYASRMGYAPRSGQVGSRKVLESTTSRGENITHLWIPDTQVRYGVPLDHIKALGNYIVEKKFDKIIIAGDWWDMPAISKWNSPKEQERLRVVDDIEAGNRAMSILWKPIEDYNRGREDKYLPERHFLFGNHEHRITRFIEENPALESLLGFHLLHLDRFQLRCHDFLVPVTIDGIAYCHYFCNPMSGKPYSGMIETRLKNIGCSFTQGHAQSFAYGERELPNGSVHHGLVSGAFYMHEEGYKGPQGNHHWRGVIVKNEVRDGTYDIMKVSLNFLLRRYL